MHPTNLFATNAIPSNFFAIIASASQWHGIRHESWGDNVWPFLKNEVDHVGIGDAVCENIGSKYLPVVRPTPDKRTHTHTLMTD